MSATTQVKEIIKSYSVEPKIAIGKNIKSLLLKGFELQPKADFLESRKPMLVNKDCTIGLAAPQVGLPIRLFIVDTENENTNEIPFV
jgi:homogentisate 1,2-dioxygenase